MKLNLFFLYDMKDSMSNLKTQLSLKETKLGETERMLSCVKSVLYKTENEKQEQVTNLTSTTQIDNIHTFL